MKRKKLNIEIHPSNKDNGLNYSKTNTNQNFKNIKIFKNLLKAKLEDRHRIKGISFSNGKKEFNTFSLYKLKKAEEATKNELSEAIYLRSLRDYGKLKHEIYLKEQKEKKLLTNEAMLKEKFVKRDINYTFLKETIYQFMRFKKNHINYNTNLLKSKDELKRANKIAKSNFINKTIKNVSRRFNDITGKIDMGIIHNEEMLNEKEYDDLIEQISKSRLKHLKSFQAPSTGINNSNFKYNNDLPTFEPFKTRKTQEYEYKNEQFISYFQNNEEENNKEDEDENELLLNLLESSKNNYEKKNDKNNGNEHYPPVCKTDSNINHNIITKKFESGKAISKNLKSNISKNDNKRAQSTKYKTHIFTNPIGLEERNKKNIKKSNIFDIKENDSENISSNSIKENLKKNNKDIDKLNESSLIIKDIINLETIKKNNITKDKQNPKYWNNNNKRVKTAGSRNTKVINKPLYIAKISDFVKEYKRIKSVSKKSKKRMEERHFTTMENIEKISKIKEELLMFILKMKYLHCAFPQKKTKAVSKKELFMRKLKNHLEVIDNPYSLATRQLKTEIKNDYSKKY